jgi:VIT1/CCC1 family predicted Fe2+/Mn2+ transporter
MASGKQGPGTASRKGRSTGRATTRAVRQPQEANARYTPPIPRKYKQSPKWMGFAILAAFVLGALVIILSYVEVLPDHGSGWYLVAGIVLMITGLGLATQYR